MSSQRQVELRILPEIEAYLRPQTAQERADLERSIREDGLKEPITYWRDGIIIDGHHRFHLCQKLGIPIRCAKVKQELNTIAEVKLWMRKNQLFRGGRKYSEHEARVERMAIFKMEIELGINIEEAVSELAKTSGLSKRTIYREIGDDKLIKSLPEKTKQLAGGEDEIRRMKRPGIKALASLSTAAQEDILERHDGNIGAVERELSKRREPKKPREVQPVKDIIGEPREDLVTATKADKKRVEKRPAAKALREALEHLARANKAMYEAKDAVAPSDFAAWRQRLIDLDKAWSDFIEYQLSLEGADLGKEVNPFF